jgi:hypothetical protein
MNKQPTIRLKVRKHLRVKETNAEKMNKMVNNVTKAPFPVI